MDLNIQNRRAHCRKKFDLTRNILVNEKREARLIDISLGGLCFHSDDAHELGIEIIVGNRLMSLFARVLGCRPNTVENGHGVFNGHKVRCAYIATKGLLQEEVLMELLEGEDNSATA